MRSAYPVEVGNRDEVRLLNGTDDTIGAPDDEELRRGAHARDMHIVEQSFLFVDHRFDVSLRRLSIVLLHSLLCERGLV